MAPTKRNTKGMGGYKSVKHQMQGGIKQVVDPHSGVGQLDDEYGTDNDPKGKK